MWTAKDMKNRQSSWFYTFSKGIAVVQKLQLFTAPYSLGFGTWNFTFIQVLLKSKNSILSSCLLQQLLSQLKF